MNNPELLLMRNRLLVGIGICMVLLLPLFLFMFNKINQDDSQIVQAIKNEETFFLLVKDKNTPRYEKELKDYNVKYKVTNPDKDRNYLTIFQSLEISENDVDPPALLYIENGKIKATLNQIEEKEDVITFMNNFTGKDEE